MHNHLEVSCPEDVAKMEEEFAEVIRKRGPDFKSFQVNKTKLPLKKGRPMSTPERLQGNPRETLIHAIVP